MFICLAVELLSITASEYNAALLLKAKDNRGRPLLDVLIENEQVRYLNLSIEISHTKKQLIERSCLICIRSTLFNRNLDWQSKLVVC